MLPSPRDSQCCVMVWNVGTCHMSWLESIPVPLPESFFFTRSYCLKHFPTSNTSCKVQYGWECVYFSLSRPHHPSSSPSIDTFTIMQELFHPSMKISKKISVRKMLQYYFSLPPPPPVCVVKFDWCFHIFAITTKKKTIEANRRHSSDSQTHDFTTYE